MASVTVATRPAEPQKREASVRSTGHLIPGPKSFNCQLELNGDRESAPAKVRDFLSYDHPGRLILKVSRLSSEMGS